MSGMNDPLSRPDGPQQARDRRDPWDRFGWLMGVIWVFFLYFPIHAALAAGLGPVATAVACQMTK